MAAKRTFTILLSVIIMVVLLLVVVASLVMPGPGIYEGGKLKITDMLLPSTGLGGAVIDFSIGITEGDSQLDKVGKIFKKFNPDFIYVEDVYGEGIGNKLYNKITIEGDDAISPYDITDKIIDMISEWDTINTDYEVYCPMGANDPDAPIQTTWAFEQRTDINNDCWYDTVPIPLSCTVYYGVPGSITPIDKTNGHLNGKKTIRIMWINKNDGKIAPFITVCGE